MKSSLRSWTPYRPQIRQPLMLEDDLVNLLEVVLDLGRSPEARFPGHESILSQHEVTQEDLDYVTSRISLFGDDNRAGIARTLHRISAIKNRQGKVVGLTCRVGRRGLRHGQAYRGSYPIRGSVLLLGRPGIGKTTMYAGGSRGTFGGC